MDSRLGDRPCYEFGEYRLDANRRVIEALAANRRLLLPPRIFDAALYFVRHRGLLLSKERLLAELWPAMVVEENSLSQVISLLRRALGSPQRQSLRRDGAAARYRFVADVVRVAVASERLKVSVEICHSIAGARSTTTNDWRPELREHSASARRVTFRLVAPAALGHAGVGRGRTRTSAARAAWSVGPRFL
jgi:DNA-binding winged helix-turn-helix (wHTH) protein